MFWRIQHSHRDNLHMLQVFLCYGLVLRKAVILTCEDTRYMNNICGLPIDCCDYDYDCCYGYYYCCDCCYCIVVIVIIIMIIIIIVDG